MNAIGAAMTDCVRPAHGAGQGSAALVARLCSTELKVQLAVVL